MLVLVLVGASTWCAAAPAGAGSPQSSCPGDASLGTVRFARAGREHVVSLSTCNDREVDKAAQRHPPASFRSQSGLVASVRTAGSTAKRGSETILVDGRPVYRITERYGNPGPIILVGWSPDSRWILFSIDPMSSASIAADGLELKTLNVASGRVVPVAQMLLDDDYLTWCGLDLVLTAGRDRVATNDKRLVVATAPDWRPRALWSDPRRAFGSVACAPDGKSVAVLSQAASDDADFFHTKWQLWKVTLDGAHTLLDAPPAGYADESPRWSRDGTSLMFVREHKGVGQLMLIRGGRAIGPFASLGYDLGYYGHHDWWLGRSWSDGQ